MDPREELAVRSALIVTTDEIPNPNALVENHLERRDRPGLTTDMIFDVPPRELTGTTFFRHGDPHAPRRVGMARKPPLRDGDRVTIEVEKIGKLENPVAEIGKIFLASSDRLDIAYHDSKGPITLFRERHEKTRNRRSPSRPPQRRGSAASRAFARTTVIRAAVVGLRRGESRRRLPRSKGSRSLRCVRSIACSGALRSKRAQQKPAGFGPQEVYEDKSIDVVGIATPNAGTQAAIRAMQAQGRLRREAPFPQRLQGASRRDSAEAQAIAARDADPQLCATARRPEAGGGDRQPTGEALTVENTIGRAKEGPPRPGCAL